MASAPPDPDETQKHQPLPAEPAAHPLLQKQEEAPNAKSWILTAATACCGLYVLVMGMTQPTPHPAPPPPTQYNGFVDDNRGPHLNKLATPPPYYPTLMEQRNITGMAIVGCDIDEKGKAHGCHIEKGTNPYFNQAGLDFMSHAVFFPAMQHGKPVSHPYHQRIKFRMGAPQSTSKYGPPLFTGEPIFLPFLP